MSLVSSMGIAQQALSVNQAAITVVSNNIANVDTEGYSKLRVNQVSITNNAPSAGNAISIAESCSGVSISSISRYSDFNLQCYYWQENSLYSYLDEYSSIASNVQDLVNELNDTGLSGALNNFYNAATALSNNPKDITVRRNYVDAAQNVCDVFNSISSKLGDIKKSLVGNATADGSLDSSEIHSELDDVNSLLDQLANVNFGIVKTQNNNTSSPSLLDQRDLLVNKLSALISVNVVQNSNGTVNVSLGNNYLVKSVSVEGYLQASPTGDIDNPVKIGIVDSSDPTVVIAPDVTDEIDGGSIGAILDICGSANTNFTISGVLGNLDTMASEFASVLNRIQTSTDYPSGTNTPMCLTADGTALQVSANPMFVSDTITHSTVGITASNIAVDSNIINNPYLVAAARVATADVGDTDEIGNNSNVQLILDARSNSTYYSNLGGANLEQYLANIVSSAGADVENIDTRLKNQTLVVNEVETNLKSLTGINMNEELMDLMKYQQAYEAAARVFSICNEIMKELTNLGR